eukprot:scaffold195170_cov24-Tisochrysis_lutea.AAC.2
MSELLLPSIFCTLHSLSLGRLAPPAAADPSCHLLRSPADRYGYLREVKMTGLIARAVAVRPR